MKDFKGGITMKECSCPVCKGKGEYNTESNAFSDKVVYPVKCTYCNGIGKVPKGAIYKGIRRN